MRDIDLDSVASLIRNVARDELLPRFATLGDLVVHAKPTLEDPQDLVTEADFAVERILTEELRVLLPGSLVVGEEATAADPTLRDALAGTELVWLVDPLDGTKNFAAGRETFGVLVALCRSGDAIASWIHLPVTGEMFIAETGAGATLDGVRLCAAAPAEGDALLTGTPYTRFMSPELRARVEARAAERVRVVDGAWSAAHEYAALSRGTKDFALYWRLLPWDHAPCALLLHEVGGSVRHGDGRAYRAADRDTLALAVRHAALWDRVRDALLG